MGFDLPVKFDEALQVSRFLKSDDAYLFVECWVGVLLLGAGIRIGIGIVECWVGVLLLGTGVLANLLAYNIKISFSIIILVSFFRVFQRTLPILALIIPIFSFFLFKLF